MGVDWPFSPWLQISSISHSGGVQVPLFIVVQTFHYYKKNTYTIPVRKTLARVVIPFLTMQAFIVLLLWVKNGFGGLKDILLYFITDGGYGQGDYYPVVYVQIAMLLPIFAVVNNKLWSKHKFILLFGYIFLCEGMEILCSFTHIPDSIYRFLAVRYVFLLYFGYQWTKEGIILNKWNLIVCIASLFLIIYFAYFPSIDNEPYFFNTVWRYHRWPCYFFTTQFLVWLLYVIYGMVGNLWYITPIIRFLAKFSYEIFLVQMVAYVMFPVSCFSQIPYGGAGLVRFFVATAFSIAVAPIFHLVHLPKKI